MTPDWSTLDEVIAGEVVVPGSPGFDAPPRTFNARFHDPAPQAIVRCASAGDVAETVAFVARHDLPSAMRSGGHCFAGWSSTRGAVIDVGPMSDVAVSASGEVATIGAGTRLGVVYEALQSHGRTIPGGTCPSVGIAGLTLGGGLGILGRAYGVTSDRLIAAQVVLADGRIVDCDSEHEPDLFWALRGAGAGNFGVVTSLAFRTVVAPEATNFHLVWPHGASAAVVSAWQQWAPTGPDQLAASLKITTTGDVDQPPSVDVYGALADGSESEADDLVDRLVVLAGVQPSSVLRRRMTSPETRGFWAQLGEDVGLAAAPEAAAAAEAGVAAAPDPLVPEPHYLFAKSEFFRHPLPVEAITALVGTLVQDRTAGESRELDFMPWGGAYNRVPSDVTAFVHRDALFQLKHAAVVDPEPSSAAASSSWSGRQAAAHRWVGASWASVHLWGSGQVFQNFADPDLPDWAQAYYGTNYGRLVEIKRRYDPENAFRFHQSLPLRSAG